MKTARFADVVKQSGAPETHLLWVPPSDDKVFQRALKEHRIMTVHQQLVGAKKDFATVGFSEEANAQYLVFPKSVKRFADRHIVGINYDLLAQPSHPAPPAKPKTSKREHLESKPKHVTAPEERSDRVVPFVAAENPELPVPEAAPKPAHAPEPEPPAKEKTTPLDSHALSEIKKAMKELRAGKAVPAYERLARLADRPAS
jgi:hypothetical protein